LVEEIKMVKYGADTITAFFLRCLCKMGEACWHCLIYKTPLGQPFGSFLHYV